MTDVRNNSLITRDVQSVVSDDVPTILAPSQLDDPSHLMTTTPLGRVSGLSLSHSERPIELPDLTFKTIGSPQFDNPDPHLLDRISDRAHDDGSTAVTATDWSVDTKVPQELGAALSAVFERVISPPSTLVQLSTECQVNGRYEGDVSPDDSLDDVDQSVHEVCHVSALDYKYPDTAGGDGLRKSDNTDKSSVPELTTRLSVEKCGVPKAVSVVCQFVDDQYSAGTDSALISTSANQIYFEEACCVGCFRSERLSVYSHSDKWLQLRVDISNGKGRDLKVLSQ